MFNDLIEAVLMKFGLDYKLISGGSKYLLKCPFHHDTSASFTIRADTGLYGCFSCGTSGPDLKHFMKRMAGDKVDIRDFLTEKDEFDMKLNRIYTKSALKLIQYDSYIDFLQAYTFESQGFLPALKNEEARKYLLEERKLSESIVKKFELKYCVSGRYEGRIIIPYKVKEKIIGFNSRLIGVDKSEGKEQRYRYLISLNEFEGFLYNFEDIDNKDYCILVEGPFDLMYLVQNGYKNVISTLNTRVSVEHLLKISEFKKIIFCFDNDKNERGKQSMLKASQNILRILPDKPIFNVDLPKYKDPNECTPEELKVAFSHMKKIAEKKKPDREVSGRA